MVFKAHNIILSQVRSALHLNDFQRRTARIDKTMLGAKRDICGLIFTQHNRGFSNGDLAHAFHYDPMLGAMVMQLQRKRRTGVDHNPLHLEPLTQRKRFIPTPGTKHANMRVFFRALAGCQPRHEFFDVLGNALWSATNTASPVSTIIKSLIPNAAIKRPLECR